jgi:opacity protein-like surface antigen
MKKTLLASIVAAQLLTQLHAGGDIEPVEMNEPEMMEHEAEESKFYIVAAGSIDFGDTVDHEGIELRGDQDFGFGIDLGYRLGSGFAVEYDFTYARNTVSRTENGVDEEAEGTYYTSAIDLVYVYEATENIGIFGKVGYEYEWETIDEYNIDNTEHDFVFGAGLEIAMNESYKLLVEYEYSLIESPRGPSIFAGVMYNF